MKLPNVENAIVDAAKVRDYLRSAVHPVGRFKSRVFIAAGYQPREWQRLRDDLLALARRTDGTLTRTDAFGQRFVGTAVLSTPSGRLLPVVTLWLIIFRGRRSSSHYRVSGRLAMSIHELDSVVLEQDLPEHGLRKENSLLTLGVADAARCLRFHASRVRAG